MISFGEQAKIYAQLIAQAWSDEAFKERLVTEPMRVLSERGVEVPPGIEIKVVENTDQMFHIVLPPPQDGDLAPGMSTETERVSLPEFGDQRMAALVADAATNRKVKERLVEEPASVIREYGIEAPPDAQVRVIECTDNLLYYVLPAIPDDELIEDVLDLVVGGIFPEIPDLPDFELSEEDLARLEAERNWANFCCTGFSGAQCSA